uniref:NAD(P)-dependent oxidoreductase n=1 Tax=candidate division CPR3 bacterium TaxID=2268181 RepID=A0A7V3N567_UNCC3
MAKSLRIKIAILGGTSHIAKGLIFNFSQKKGYELSLFVRSFDRMRKFLDEISCTGKVQIKQFSDLSDDNYDVLINCIGISSAEDIANNIQTVFELTEHFDNLILDYLKKHPSSLYINFSSGAVFGTEFDRPVDETSTAKWEINNITEAAYYGIAKLNAEAKHRSFKDFNIVDLRIFGYFSRFIDLRSKYILTEILNCLKNKKEFVTDSKNIIRDYLHPKDLFSLVEKCMEVGRINDVYDTFSLKPVTKFEVLDYFFKEYGLKYAIKEDAKVSSLTGVKSAYYSNNRKAQSIGYNPQYTSMDCIAQESKIILWNSQGNLC